MEALTIGKLAQQAHVNRETVRYYERRRLLPRASRSISGYRIFPDDALRRLRFIRHAKVLRFSLNEIHELLALRVNSRVDSIDACDRVRKRTKLKLIDIEGKIQSLKHMKDALSELIEACSKRGRTNECPILDNLEANGWFEQHSRQPDSIRSSRKSHTGRGF
jgi:MerR family copper efflux transcriptional regulator